MRHALTALFLTLAAFSYGQAKKVKVLLIGTFHFNNPGSDAVKEKDYDILSAESQKELEWMAERIKSFRPSQVFVEWEYDQQRELDSLYRLYLDGQYFSSLDKQARHYRYYSQGEIFQLAFRVSRKADIRKVTAIDYEDAVFPYDSMMTAIRSAGQTRLLDWNKQYNEVSAANSARDKSLTQKLLRLNSKEERRDNRSWYLSFASRAGNDKTFVGAYLTSEWYRRNLYMYSLVQKNITPDDDRIVVLLGAGHISLIEQFVKDDDRFELVELRDVLK